MSPEDTKEYTATRPMPEGVRVGTTGAKRSGPIQARYDLIPQDPVRRLALRYGLGSKYGEWNWEQGLEDPVFVKDAYNHLVEHLIKGMDRIRRRLQGESLPLVQEDDDLAAVAWGAFFLMEAERRLKEKK